MDVGPKNTYASDVCHDGGVENVMECETSSQSLELQILVDLIVMDCDN